MSLLAGLHYTRLTESVTFPMENLCRQSHFGYAITPPLVSWRHVSTHQSRGLRETLAVSLPIFSRHMLYGGQAFHGCIIFPSPGRIRPSVPFNVCCFSRTTLRASDTCLVRYVQLGSRIALFFVVKIATNYRLSISFSKSTPTL